MKNRSTRWGMKVALTLLAGAVQAGEAPSRVRCVSHRGESMVAPENTMASFRTAIERGADGFECDIYLTADNQIVCLHDGSAKRTTGKDVKPCDATLAELQALDAGSWKSARYAGERMPSLAQALSLAHDNFEIYVEVKCGPEVLPRLAEVLAAEPKATPDRVLFISFSTNVVSELRQRLPAYRAYWITSPKRGEDGKVTPTASAAVAAAKACRASGIDAKATDALSEAYVREVKQAGLSFHVWTVNSADQAAALAAMGVDTITSDCGATLAALLKPRPEGGAVIRWPFDGTATNRGSGGPFFGAALSGAPVFTAGVAGQALVLDGSNVFASAACPFRKQGTVSLWYRPEAFYNFNTVFDNACNANQWEMWIGKDATLRFRMGKESAELACDLGSLGGKGRWYHVALAWDEPREHVAKLYVDGVERASAAVNAWVSPAGLFHIGGGNSGNTKGQGAVDDVRVYETALTGSQVRALYDARGAD